MQIIKLTQGKVAVVDDDIMLPAKKFSTKPHGKTFYAKCTMLGAKGKPTTVYLHHFVAGFPLKGFEVDHINGDGLDNRRENLRVATRRQNMQNQHGVSKTSSHRGVYWNPAADKWQAYVHYNNQSRYLGVFSSQIDALVARQFAERILGL